MKKTQRGVIITSMTIMLILSVLGYTAAVSDTAHDSTMQDHGISE